MRSANPFCLPALSRQTRATLLLVLGLLAMAMLLFGGSRTVRAEAGSFYAEVCTSKGIVAAAGQGTAGNVSHQDGESHTDCCQLCTITASLLAPDTTIAVLPAPTFGSHFAAEAKAPPALVAHLAHPPRGPPLL